MAGVVTFQWSIWHLVTLVATAAEGTDISHTPLLALIMWFAAFTYHEIARIQGVVSLWNCVANLQINKYIAFQSCIICSMFKSGKYEVSHKQSIFCH